MWRCRICDATYLTIPEGAVLIAPSRRHRFSALYRFPDGTTHDLRRVKDPPVTVTPEELPEPRPPMPPPAEQVQVPETLPEPEIFEEAVIEVEKPKSPTTSMAFAFRRSQKKS